MDEFEQSDLEKKTNGSHNTCYQNGIHYAFARLKECPSTQQHDCNVDKTPFVRLLMTTVDG